MSAKEQQVGGSHYKDLAIQPAQYTTANGIGHLAGDAIAYITRYKRKNGKEDLEKAIHSLQLLIELEYPEEASKGCTSWRYFYRYGNEIIYRLSDKHSTEGRFLSKGSREWVSMTPGCFINDPEISEAQARKLVEEAGGVW